MSSKAIHELSDEEFTELIKEYDKAVKGTKELKKELDIEKELASHMDYLIRHVDWFRDYLHQAHKEKINLDKQDVIHWFEENNNTVQKIEMIIQDIKKMEKNQGKKSKKLSSYITDYKESRDKFLVTLDHMN